MNGLRDLNTISNQSVPYADDRPPTYTFSVADQTINPIPKQSIQLPSGIAFQNIVSINNPLIFQINVAAQPGTTITWANLAGQGTGNLTITSNNGLYTVSGIKSLTDWHLVSTPTMNLTLNQSDWSFVSNLIIENNFANSVGYTTTVKMADLHQLTDPGTVTYYTNGSNKIQNPVQMFDLPVTNLNPSSYTLYLATNNASLMSNLAAASALGGSTSYNAGNLAISGNAAQVNSLLANVTYTVSTTNNDVANLTYTLTNALIPYTSIKTQMVKNTASQITSNLFLTHSYIGNRSDYAIFANNTPQITESSVGSDTYVVYIEPSAGYVGFNNAAVTSNLTISGTKSAVNTAIANVKYYPVRNSISTVIVNYTQIKNGTEEFYQPVNLTGFWSNGANPSAQTFTVTSSQTLNLDYAQKNYLPCDILIVGGGAGGGGIQYENTAHLYECYPGGGGAGEVQEYLNQYFNQYGQGNVTINIGAGGTGGVSGGTDAQQCGTSGFQSNILVSNVVAYTAAGGSTSTLNPVAGGRSGNGYAGGAIYNYYVNSNSIASYWGGGGGATGPGLKGNSIVIAHGGQGGPGKVSTITGNTYGFGGNANPGANSQGYPVSYVGTGSTPPNTGNGGGFSTLDGIARLAGSSGIVIIKFKG